MKLTSAEVPKLEYTHVPCPDFDSRLARALDLIVALVLAYLQHGSKAVSRKRLDAFPVGTEEDGGPWSRPGETKARLS